jgi:hypothetical protein
MNYWKFSTILASVLFTLSCSAPQEPPPPKSVLDPMLQAEQRARDVQKTVDQHADATRKAVDTQERGDTTP